MFGYVLVNKPELKIKDFEKYRSYYCGLCHALGEMHGMAGRLTLNYDMTFLIMILTDLYETEETITYGRCPLHPARKHCARRSPVTDYCADMCVLLAYYKCKDDWDDEKKLKAKAGMNGLKKKEEEPAPAPAKEPRLCPYCRMEIADDATRCPHCTSQLEEAAE